MKPQSAKAKGRLMENAVVDFLNAALGTDTIERRRLNGVNDRGDVSGVRFNDRRIVLEVKNTATLSVAEHLREAHTEARNDGALLGAVVQKRRGLGIADLDSVGEQLVFLTLHDFALLLNGGFPLAHERPSGGDSRE